MKVVSIALFLAVLTAPGAFSQNVDYRISISGGGALLPGGDVAYEIVVTADGSTYANEPFVVRIGIPRELEIKSVCTGAVIAELRYDPPALVTWSDRFNTHSNGSKSCPMTFRVSPSMKPGKSFLLSAELVMKPDPNPENDYAALTGSIRSSSDVEVECSTNVLRFTSGTAITYTFTVTNRGPQDAHDVWLVDQMFSGVRFVSFEQTSGPAASLAAPQFTRGIGMCFEPRCGAYVEAHIPFMAGGSVATFQLVADAAPSGDSTESADIINRAYVSSSSPDFERYKYCDSWTYAGPNADLRITSSRLSGASALLAPIAITVSNKGPDTVNHVKVVHVLSVDHDRSEFADKVKFVSVTPSQGTCAAPVIRQPYGYATIPPYWTMDCTLGALAPGASATIAAVIDTTSSNVSFEHSAEVSPAQNDPNRANNWAQLPVTPVRRRASGR